MDPAIEIMMREYGMTAEQAAKALYEFRRGVPRPNIREDRERPAGEDDGPFRASEPKYIGPMMHPTPWGLQGSNSVYVDYAHSTWRPNAGPSDASMVPWALSRPSTAEEIAGHKTAQYGARMPAMGTADDYVTTDSVRSAAAPVAREMRPLAAELLRALKK